MKQDFFLFIVFAFFISQINAQSVNKNHLITKSYKSLLMMYEVNSSDTILVKQIAKTYIKKALKDKDSTKIARGYSWLALVSKMPKAIKYLDTTIIYSKNSSHKSFPALGYLSKSSYFFNNDEYEKSLKNAILGYKYADIKNNVDQQITALHQINAVNELWGDFKKVLETNFLAYNLIQKSPNSKHFLEHYLYSLEGIGKCYIRLKKPDSALYYFNKGIKKALKEKDSATYLAFVSRSGMALNAKGNYKKALDSLIKGDKNRTMYNNSYLPYFYFYAGNSYYNLKQKEKAVSYFKKIDSIYDKKHVLSPELPLVYDKLVSYYQERNNKELQLKYLYKLIRVERVIGIKKEQIKEKTDIEYHLPKIFKEKENIIADLNNQNKNYSIITWWILGFLSVSIALLVYYVNRQLKFKKRYDRLVNKKVTKKLNTSGSLSQEISIHIIEEILSQLNDFELNKKYLNHTISLSEVAKSFKTNSTYLSKVINLKKDKNFSQYINDLRIDYTIQELEGNPTFKKYTIKAIAYESGFKNAESFSKAFYKKYGIYPSYYLKQMKNK